MKKALLVAGVVASMLVVVTTAKAVLVQSIEQVETYAAVADIAMQCTPSLNPAGQPNATVYCIPVGDGVKGPTDSAYPKCSRGGDMPILVTADDEWGLTSERSIAVVGFDLNGPFPVRVRPLHDLNTDGFDGEYGIQADTTEMKTIRVIRTCAKLSSLL